ncbi:unnamed protein product [Cyprideis torosa]|uniref:Uncharacterized protein n=1 Tax=Cyprideis torosa TaxID=163714 RepID=A0A7R8W4L4_9CRUS|nr:unnamed protein product [Cyprideis torosa]CAG0884331.1 unnamed protein product [Cyprideis torosa]
MTAMEAETTYKACVAEANERHGALLAVKASVIQAAREIILQCDQTMKAVTVAYFQLQHAVSAAAPVQFQTLCESSRLYEPGSQYIEFVRRLPRPPLDEPVEMSPYSFEPFAAQDEERRKGSGPPDTDDRRRKAWSGGPLFPSASACDMKLASGGVSDTDSLSSHGGGIPPHHLVPESGRASIASSGDDLDVPGGASQQASRRSVMSKAAKTHTFRNLKTPSRCRECDSYIYFQGADCMECGLCVHKKCLETLAIQCGHKRLPRKTTTFSLDISQHLSEAGVLVPHLVTKCVSEIERRGMKVKGIYRVSGVKSRVEKLCQAFENGAELVDVTEVHPNVIANVLKLYLRQLPEPLLTYKLYPEFVRLAKECPSDTAVDIDDRIQDLRELCAHLPEKHQPTLSYLMHHLRRVSEESDTNNMPPSNLGIVFGPTLLRMAEGAASLNSLVDTIHQTRAIEMLVVHADTIFGPPPNLSPQYSTALQRSPASRSESIDSTGSNTSLGTSPGAGGRGAGSGGSGGTSSSSSGTASSGTAGFLKPLMRSLSSVSGAQAMAGGKTKQVSPVLRSPVSQGDGSCSPVVERREGLPSAELLAARSVVLPGYIAGVEDSLPPSTTHPDRGVSSEPQSAGASDDDLSIELPDESDQRRSPLLRRIGSPSGSPSQQFSSPQTGTWPSPLPKPSAETRQSTSPVTGTGQGTRSQVDSGITDSSLDSDLSLDVAETRYKGRHQVEDVEIGPRAGGASLDNLTSSESSQDVNEDYEGYLDVRGSDTSLTSSPNLMGFVLQSSDADFIDGGSSCETHSSSLRVDSPRAPRSPSSSTSSASAPVDTSSPLSSQGPSRVKIELPSSSIMSGLPSEKLVRSILDPSKLGGKHPEIITTSVRKGITSSSNPSATRHTPKSVSSPKNETGLSKQGQEKFV